MLLSKFWIAGKLKIIIYSKTKHMPYRHTSDRKIIIYELLCIFRWKALYHQTAFWLQYTGWSGFLNSTFYQLVLMSFTGRLPWPQFNNHWANYMDNWQLNSAELLLKPTYSTSFVWRIIASYLLNYDIFHSITISIEPNLNSILMAVLIIHPHAINPWQIPLAIPSSTVHSFPEVP